jgi:hypothetical protein
VAIKGGEVGDSSCLDLTGSSEKLAQWVLQGLRVQGEEKRREVGGRGS